MKSPAHTLASILLAFTTLAMSARGEIEFLFDVNTPSLADGLVNGDRMTVNGLTLTFSNIVTSNDGGIGELDPDIPGILISGIIDEDYSDVVSLDITFSEDVVISSYKIGDWKSISAGRFFTLAGAGGVSGENVIPAGSSGTSVSLPFVQGGLTSLKAGQAYTLSHNLPNDTSLDAWFDLESLCVKLAATAVPPLGPRELVAPRIAISGGNVDFTVQPSVAGRTYQLQVSDTMAAGTWQDVGEERVGDGNDLVISIPYVPSVRQRFYRLALVGVTTVP
jgi:hypothetical protein